MAVLTALLSVHCQVRLLQFCNSSKCSELLCPALHCDTLQCSALKYSAVQLMRIAAHDMLTSGRVMFALKDLLHIFYGNHYTVTTMRMIMTLAADNDDE